MKKLLIISLLIAVIPNFLAAQTNYFQFGIGTGYLMDANTKDSPLLQFEYGKNYKWFDITVAFESANTHDKYKNSYETYNSIFVKTKFDLVRMFLADTRHSVKVGVGKGIGTAGLKNFYDDLEPLKLYSITNVLASYEYKITDKIWLGAYGSVYPHDSFFGGMHYVGLTVRRAF